MFKILKSYYFQKDFFFYKVTCLKKCDIILHIFDQIKSFKDNVSQTLLSLHGESLEIMFTALKWSSKDKNIYHSPNQKPLNNSKILKKYLQG